MFRRASCGVLAALLATLLAGCAAGADEHPDATAGTPAASGTPVPDTHDEPGEQARPVPLREGERRLQVEMPTAYRPSAPEERGTDDYRCFLLDPGLDHDAFITGTDVRPGTPTVVHHVILFEVPPDQVGRAHALDAEEPGEGWTCFGGSGLEAGSDLDDAPWLGAWAPGGGESVLPAGFGRPVEAGSQIVMQVHYNLLAGPKPDTSATRLRLADASAHLRPVETMLLPAPVELPCRPEHDGGALCDRDTSMADVVDRFGSVGRIGDWLHLLCGPVSPGPVQTCARTVRSSATVIGAAGHMHLLGQTIKIELNPGTAEAQTILDIPAWDFDNQTAKPVDAVELSPGDRVEVTCEHSQRLRDLLPAFEGQPDRYVVWGEGTTDEMCLGILQVAPPR